MPKLKTHRGAAKRFKKTATGSSCGIPRSSVTSRRARRRSESGSSARRASRRRLTHRRSRGCCPTSRRWGPGARGRGRCTARTVAWPTAGGAEAWDPGCHPLVIGSGAGAGTTRPPLDVEWPWRSEHAESEAWHRAASQAQAAPVPCQGLLPQQEQAAPRRQGSGGQGAELRLCRPAEQEARLPPPVDRPHQRGGPGERLHLPGIDSGIDRGAHRHRPQAPGHLAVADPAAFAKVVEQARQAIAAPARA